MFNIKKIYDVSRIVYSGVTVWPGDEGVELKRIASMDEGAKCNVSVLKAGVHTATHVDAPVHFINGAEDVCSIDLSKFIGMVKVFELYCSECIKKSDIEQLGINKNDRVFFKTANSKKTLDEPFNKEFIYIDISAAKFLIDIGVEAVGVDYLSIEKYDSHHNEVHKLLLSNKIAIIEGLYLKDIKQGTYFYSCLPLALKGADGSPVRAILAEI